MAAQPSPSLEALTEAIRRDPEAAARRVLDHEAERHTYLSERERHQAERASYEAERARLAAEQAQHAVALRSANAEIRALRLQLRKLLEQQRLARAERFAASSERHDLQYRLFDEGEAQAAPETLDTEATVRVPAHERQVATRKPLPADLPRQVVEHPPERTHCDCGSALVRIGTKTSEQLDIIPEQVFVIEHRRGSWKCPCCEDAIPETAPLPPQPIPKSAASPGLLAFIATRKYADGLPLYRQSQAFERLGIDLPRQTLARYLVQGGALLAPLVERLKAHLLAYDVLALDETRVQVLKEDGRPAQSQSWMWVAQGGPEAQPAIVYHYDPSRGSAVPRSLLEGYRGYLQTDGYAGYGAVLEDPAIRGLGCWAHARRRFVRARKALPKGKPSEKLNQILAWIQKLYALERRWKRLAPEARAAHRRAEALPILDKIEVWLARQDPPPQTLLGKAIGYLRSEWPRLSVYIEDGRLSIDNNAVENAIRPFAVGRKNWLFSDRPEGARSSAVLYSLVETAKLNGLNPYAYLKVLFQQMPTCNGSASELDALLPWHVDAEVINSSLVGRST